MRRLALPQAVARSTCSIFLRRSAGLVAISQPGTSPSLPSSPRGRWGSHVSGFFAWVSSRACSTPSLSAHMPPPRSTARLRIQPVGDTALVAELGTRLDTAINSRAIALAAALKKRRDVRQAIAGYASVTVHFDPDQTTHDSLAAAIKRLAAKRPPMAEPGRLHRIPVFYDGLDMQEVAARVNLSPEKIIEIHTRPIYRVFLVGFVPGWAYLGPLAEELELPRRHAPRTLGPAGSVG